jgi:hypothetical protein
MYVGEFVAFVPREKGAGECYIPMLWDESKRSGSLCVGQGTYMGGGCFDQRFVGEGGGEARGPFPPPPPAHRWKTHIRITMQSMAYRQIPIYVDLKEQNAHDFLLLFEQNPAVSPRFQQLYHELWSCLTEIHQFFLNGVRIQVFY